MTLTKGYSIENFKEFVRDSRFQMREEVDHMKRTFANKSLKISGDVVFRALMTPDMDSTDNWVYKPPNMKLKLSKLNNPLAKVPSGKSGKSGKSKSKRG
eukprot:CAMPEP_0116948280 /NCGR_PEP_ID=MMETSP0467-20121206/38235_1 /TAXON_ID=283647 /ORGANISM="Mesodinium pulex, Strain SPMC105" /LENGTH=98 /DNA_ID=CAMNT_0004632715 /DNA_START=1430 /DNA_END=1726 /DNA_ORIENTATION=+